MSCPGQLKRTKDKTRRTNKKQHIAKWANHRVRTGANLVNPMATGFKSELTNLSNTFSQQFAAFILATSSLVVILLQICIIAYISQQQWKVRDILNWKSFHQPSKDVFIFLLIVNGDKEKEFENYLTPFLCPGAIYNHCTSTAETDIKGTNIAASSFLAEYPLVPAKERVEVDERIVLAMRI